MDVRTIESGLATILLDAEECRYLAQACDLALDGLSVDQPSDVYRFIQTAGGAFKAAAMTAHLQIATPYNIYQPLRDELRALGLMKGGVNGTVA